MRIHPCKRSPRASVRLTRRAAPAPELTLSGRPRCPPLVEQRHHCSRSVRDVLLASEVAMRSCSRRGGSWASQVDTRRQASKSSKILPILATGSVASASRSAGSRPTGKRSSVWQQHSQQSRSRQGLPCHMLERGIVQPVSSNVPTYIDVKALRARFRPSAARLGLQHGTPLHRS